MAANNARAQMAGGKNRSNNSLSQYKSVRVNGKKIYLIPVTGHKGLYTLKTEDGRFAGSEKVFSARTSGDAVKEMKRVAKEIEAELASVQTSDDALTTVDEYYSNTESDDDSASNISESDSEPAKGLGLFRKTGIATKNATVGAAVTSAMVADSLSDKIFDSVTEKGHEMISKSLSEISAASDKDMLGTSMPARVVQQLSRKAMSFHKDAVRRDRREFEYGVISQRKRYAEEGHAANDAALKAYKEPLYAKLDKIKADLEIERREALSAGDTEALSDINARGRKIADQRKVLDKYVPEGFQPPYPILPKKNTNFSQKGMRLRDLLKIKQAELSMHNQDSYLEAEQKLFERRSQKALKQAEKLSV